MDTVGNKARPHRDLRDQGGGAERGPAGDRPGHPGPRRRRRVRRLPAGHDVRRTCARCASPTVPTRSTSARSPGASCAGWRLPSRSVASCPQWRRAVANASDRGAPHAGGQREALGERGAGDERGDPAGEQHDPDQGDVVALGRTHGSGQASASAAVDLTAVPTAASRGTVHADGSRCAAASQSRLHARVGGPGSVRAGLPGLDRRLPAARARAHRFAGQGRRGRARGHPAPAAARPARRHAGRPPRPQAPDADLRRATRGGAGRAHRRGVQRRRGLRGGGGRGVLRRGAADRLVRHRAGRAAPARPARAVGRGGGSERDGVLRLERRRTAVGRAAVRDLARAPVPGRRDLLHVLGHRHAAHADSVPGRAHRGPREPGGRVHLGPALAVAPSAPAHLLADHGRGQPHLAGALPAAGGARQAPRRLLQPDRGYVRDDRRVPGCSAGCSPVRGWRRGSR